jgi:hypothetical protein
LKQGGTRLGGCQRCLREYFAKSHIREALNNYRHPRAFAGRRGRMKKAAEAAFDP